MVQKILSGQTFTNILNFCCDLDLEHSNPIFPQDTQAYDAVLSYHVWLQTDQQFRRYSKTSNILIINISPHCDFDIEDSEPFFFLHDTSPHDNTPSHKVWKQNAWWFRRYHLDKH